LADIGGRFATALTIASPKGFAGRRTLARVAGRQRDLQEPRAEQQEHRPAGEQSPCGAAVWGHAGLPSLVRQLFLFYFGCGQCRDAKRNGADGECSSNRRKFTGRNNCAFRKFKAFLQLRSCKRWRNRPNRYNLTFFPMFLAAVARAAIAQLPGAR
jgi:hypothetical protein